MENTGLARALRSKPIAALASRSLLATNYHAVARPSLPNYLALTSGSTWDITDDDYHVLPPGGLGAQLTAAGISWRAYMEGLTAAGCTRSPYPYALKHNPFAYYGGACPSNVVGLEALEADLQGDTPASSGSRRTSAMTDTTARSTRPPRGSTRLSRGSPDRGRSVSAACWWWCGTRATVATRISCR